ncbi:ABC transporter ATP-binding protein [Gordonia sinesedis]
MTATLAPDIRRPAGRAPGETLIQVENLRIGFGDTEVVTGVDLELRRGEILGIVGESGSGKSVTTRALVGLAGPGASVRADRFDILGEPAAERTERAWRAIRGDRIGLVLQDALTALDPLRTIGDEVGEAARIRDRGARQARVEDLLRSVGIDDPEIKRRQHAFALSGGQRQRALIASAIARDPEVLIADEPTTALDVTVQAKVLDLLVEQVRAGRSLILVSHDLAVVSSIADRVLVMNSGRVVESGPVRDVIDRPATRYTTELLAAVPRGTAPAAPPSETPVVYSAQGLAKRYRTPGGPVDALADVSFDVHAGEILGVVGESGSGKSTIARLVTGFTAADSGTQRFDGRPHHRGNRVPGSIALVAQDSVASFDPRYRVGEIIGEAVTVGRRGRAGRVTRDRELRRLLDAVHLPHASADRHPRELSGGQRQRVNIARALASGPRLVVCDEPVSALDISVQAQILDLLAELAAGSETAFLFISHDLAVVRQLCHTLLVLHRGRVIDRGPTEDVFAAPTSPHTRRLLAAIPALEAPAPIGDSL